MKPTPRQRGKLVTVLRSMGYTITGLLPRLGISRGSFYAKAPNPTLPFLLKVRKATNIKLEEHYPELKAYVALHPEAESVVEEKEGSSTPSPQPPSNKYYQLLQEYNSLVKSYTKLSKLLIKVVNKGSLEEVKEEIDSFLDKG